MMREHLNLETILQKSITLQRLDQKEIVYLLSLKTESDLKRLFAASCSLRDRYFHNKVFLYGFVYFSTWCRNSCTFCAYRRTNEQTKRYRRSENEIWEAVLSLKESGIHLVDLTMGEDPYYYEEHGFETLLDLVRRIKKETNLPVMISPGLIEAQTIKDFAQAGADWFACYQETYNETLFQKLRVNQSFEQRLLSKSQALQAGLLIEEGLLLGVGETVEDTEAALRSMRSLGADQVRVMSFVPQVGIPMENTPSPDRRQEFKAIAVLRLLFPDKLIPASLDVDGIDGLSARLTAGANVITSLIPPNAGFAGVAQHAKDINEGFRTVEGVIPVLSSLGLEVATQAEYADWLENRKMTVQETLSSR